MHLINALSRCPHAQQAELDALTEEPHHVMLCPETVSLLGVQQFFQELPGTARWWHGFEHAVA